MVVDVAQVDRGLFADPQVAALGDQAEDVALRREDLAHGHQVALQLEDAVQVLEAGQGQDRVLQLVELVGHAVQDGEVVVHDAVGDEVVDEVHAPLQQPRRR